MNLITDIDEFKQKYDDFGYVIIRDNKLSNAVLDYYINNYNNNKEDWWYISMCQTLSESFIEKYKDSVHWFGISNGQIISDDFITKYIKRIYWIELFMNKHLELSYEFIADNLYQFNLYNTYTNLRIFKSNIYIPIFERLIKEYPNKYEMDKLADKFNNL